MVREGDFVEKDQVLAQLHPDQTLADLDQIKARHSAALVKAERLRSIGNGYTADFKNFNSPHLIDIIKDQKDIFASKMRSFANDVIVVERQIDQKKAQMIGQIEKSKDLSEDMHEVEEQRDNLKGLLDKKLKTSRDVFLMDDKLGEARTKFNQVTNEIAQTKEAIAESEGRRVSLAARLRIDAFDEMGKVNAELFEMHNLILKLKDRVERLDIKSPTRGIVKNIKTHTLQGIIPPGGEIMQVVPVDNLEIEAKILPKNMGNVRAGQPATIKISAYDFARYGVIKGTVRSVSASSFLEEVKKEPYFKVFISLDVAHVGNNPRQNLVSAGMTAVVEIKTGKKKLIDFIINPITNVYTQAFRER